MGKLASLNTIEQAIEQLAPAEQLQLFENMFKQIKQALASAREQQTVTSSKPVRGAWKRYANSSLRDQESGCFSAAMKAKHANH